MPKRIVLYKCSWCNKTNPTTKKNIGTHEKYCFKNPKNKACLTCKFFKRRRRMGSESLVIAGDVYECSKLNMVYFRKNETSFFVNFNTITGELIEQEHIRDFVIPIFDIEKPIFPTINCDSHRRNNK